MTVWTIPTKWDAVSFSLSIEFHPCYTYVSVRFKLAAKSDLKPWLVLHNVHNLVTRRKCLKVERNRHPFVFISEAVVYNSQISNKMLNSARNFTSSFAIVFLIKLVEIQMRTTKYIRVHPSVRLIFLIFEERGIISSTLTCASRKKTVIFPHKFVMNQIHRQYCNFLRDGVEAMIRKAPLQPGFSLF